MNNNKSNIIWVEKYRPSNINKIIQNDDIKQLISSGNLSELPHLLFYGQPGTGKTTTALGICKYIFNSNTKYINSYDKIFKERVLELNASDERGIKIVREKIKTFAARALHNYEDIPFIKIIILDEADVITNDSQYALRRIMEQYSHITRFILICNYVTKIIPPLSSRCYKYRFNTINIDSINTIIKNILIQESVHFDENTLTDITQSIYNFSNGDLRKAITLLQRSVYISNINNEPLTGNLVKNTYGHIPKELINNLFSILTTNNNSYIPMTNAIINIFNNGFSSNIIDELAFVILNNNQIIDKHKSSIFIKISEISDLIASGSGEYIQILALCSFINFTLN